MNCRKTNRGKLLASVWRDLLRIQHISAYDNFFDLGGSFLTGHPDGFAAGERDRFAHEAERAGFSNSRAVCSKLQRKIKNVNEFGPEGLAVLFPSC